LWLAFVEPHMRALHWDGHQLRYEAAYSTPSSILHPQSATTAQAALVKFHLAGICSTDLQILKGYMGFTGVPGHEFVGSVSEGPGEWIGKRVVGEINFGCGASQSAGRRQKSLPRSYQGTGESRPSATSGVSRLK